MICHCSPEVADHAYCVGYHRRGDHMQPAELRSNVLNAIAVVEARLRTLDVHSSYSHGCRDTAALNELRNGLASLQDFLHRVSEKGIVEFYRTYADVVGAFRSVRWQSRHRATPSAAIGDCRALLEETANTLAEVLSNLPAEPKRPKVMKPAAIDFEERVLPPDDALTDVIRLQIEDVAQSILGRIGEDPREWLALGSRRFEELLAEIWRGFGWQTVLTPPVGDGGFDVRAVRNDYGITLCYLLEAKCYAPDRPVGVEIVRQLVGVVERERASHGVIATTSRYTKGAHTEVRDRQYRLTLADFQSVLGWVSTYRRITLRT